MPQPRKSRRSATSGASRREATREAVAQASKIAEARQAVAQVATGSFRRMMQVELVNDGPVTILLDSRKLF